MVGKAISTWDGDNRDRDIGMVFGTAATVDFTSDDGLGNENGSELVVFTHHIAVPAGGRATLLSFVVLTGTDTADIAAGITARATQVDAAALDIASNFRSNVLYQRGMTQSIFQFRYEPDHTPLPS